MQNEKGRHKLRSVGQKQLLECFAKDIPQSELIVAGLMSIIRVCCHVLKCLTCVRKVYHHLIGLIKLLWIDKATNAMNKENIIKIAHVLYI